ncbi:hypothetical protein ACFWXO_39420 [Kitasatospora sp. NPDC059088]|uniref:hypothetical protein n=1 Tax=Kitasatospora sp. NPDC059088 TaxID=3346722 RepID=UPI0036C9A5FD
MMLTNLIPQNDPVDAAFDSARTPEQGQASGDGGEVPFKAVCEGMEAGQVGADRVDPLREPFAFELGEHLPGAWCGR